MTLPTILAELEEALKAATPEPWEADDYGAVGKAGGRYGPGYPPRPDSIMHGNDGEYIENPKSREDARLIALMRNSLPTLLEAVKRQGEVIQRAGVQFRYYEEQHRLKGPEGETKARVNAEMAEMCEQVLEATAALKEKYDV